MVNTVNLVAGGKMAISGIAHSWLIIAAYIHGGESEWVLCAWKRKRRPQLV